MTKIKFWETYAAVKVPDKDDELPVADNIAQCEETLERTLATCRVINGNFACGVKRLAGRSLIGDVQFTIPLSEPVAIVELASDLAIFIASQD